MPLFGAHMSIAGGLHNALLAAQAHGMETVQLFTSSPSQWCVSATPESKKETSPGDPANLWTAKEIPLEDRQQFHATLKASKLKFPTAHDSYLINLASPNEALYQRSLAAFLVEVERAEALGLAYLVMHPGTPTDGDDDAGLARIVRALDTVHARCAGARVKVLLETTAGQGKTLGWRFEHLAAILDRVQESKRLGVCLDTCHVFAAGYALAPQAEYEKTLADFDRQIGLTRLKLFHLNDSKKPLASRVDRHEHIGQGHLGREPFRMLVNDARFQKIPMILETPKEGPGGEDMDVVNLQTLRDLVVKKK